MRKEDIISELVKLGYKGPTTTSKVVLERKLTSMRAVASDDFDKGAVHSDEYGTIRKGDECRIEGFPKGKWIFVRHFKSESQEYVEVRGSKRPGFEQTRCFMPTRLRTKNGGQP